MTINQKAIDGFFFNLYENSNQLADFE